MEKDDFSETDSSSLRKRAIEILHANPWSLATLPADDIEHLAQELSVYQIELEMQNEELRMAQAELGRSRQEYFDLYDFAPVGYLTLSDKGMIQRANLAASAMLRMERAYLIKQPFSKFILPDEMDIYYRHRRKVLDTREPQECELQIKQQDGGVFGAHLRCCAVTDEGNQVTTIRSVMTDITARKQAETDREMLLKTLKEKNYELEIAIKKVDFANAAKGQFLANMSHEIRTPITVILGMSELLAQQDMAKGQLADIRLIFSTAKALLCLVNDILDYSKVEAGKLNVAIEDCSPKKLLADIDLMMRPFAVGKELQFEVNCRDNLPVTLQTDHHRVHQCLVNLVNNAIKYTNRGHVHINASIEDENEKSFIRFDVEDTGIGIPQDKQESIFTPFFQVENGNTRDYGGTGLGLSVTRQLAQLLGGSLTFTSEEGNGSTFSLMIPVETEVLSQPSSGPETTIGDTTPMTKDRGQFSGKVLVAEDDAGCQILTRRILERSGLEVTIANNGQEAIEMAQKDPFDLILMDIRMPIKNGFEATEALHQGGINTPIVALTAHAMEGYRELCVEAGLDGYLTKPIEHERLMEVLHKYLRVSTKTTCPF